jgi:hypothetical protein
LSDVEGWSGSVLSLSLILSLEERIMVFGAAG